MMDLFIHGLCKNMCNNIILKCQCKEIFSLQKREIYDNDVHMGGEQQCRENASLNDILSLDPERHQVCIRPFCLQTCDFSISTSRCTMKNKQTNKHDVCSQPEER